jgi:hypothetical protein
VATAYTINPLKTKELKVHFFRMIPMHGKELGCLKFNRLHPLARMKREHKGYDEHGAVME